MKILFLSAAKSVHTVKWVNAFVSRGHEVFLIYNKGHEPKDDAIDKKVHLYRLKYGGSAGYYLNSRELSKLEREICPDVINVHYASGYGTLARKAHLSSYILSIWGSDVYDFPYSSKIKNLILKKNVRNADYLASTSNCMAQQLKKVMEDETLKIAITPFGVDLNLFNSDLFEVKEKREFIIGNIKALEDKYGIKELILAFEQLKKEIEEEKILKKPLKLLIYGSGSQKENLERLIKEHQLEDSINLMGRIPNNKVPEILNRFDVFCALSHSESFGVSAVEAMAMKKPVVVSDVDGFQEVIEDEKTGFIVKGADTDSVKEKLKTLILDGDLRIEMGEAGKKRVEKHYSWDKNVNVMLELYCKAKESKYERG